jgi:DNA-binding CsgD family transcriptional regulator
VGRPSYQPSDEDRAKVRTLAEARVALAEIARQLDVSKKTLLKHFATELGREETSEEGRGKTGQRGKTLPAFEASPEQREAVEILAASKIVTREEIADRIGVSVETLEHHFAEELRRGPAKRNTDVLIATQKLAAAGNVSAQRLWLTITGGAISKATTNAKSPAMGKKEQATANAHQAFGGGGRFAPRPAPKLVVSNPP